jgi:hypothetical protein
LDHDGTGAYHYLAQIQRRWFAMRVTLGFKLVSQRLKL